MLPWEPTRREGVPAESVKLKSKWMMCSFLPKYPQQEKIQPQAQAGFQQKWQNPHGQTAAQYLGRQPGGTGT